MAKSTITASCLGSGGTAVGRGNFWKTTAKRTGRRQSAKAMHKAGVRDIVINAYDLEAEELADFYYVIDDATGKVVKR
jgi:hypothetical protein